MIIHCATCNKDTIAKLRHGDILYPNRTDLADKSFWQCVYCGCWVGCHPNTHTPLGSIVNHEIKQLRTTIHHEMDLLLRTYTRSKVYALVSKELGYTFHAGEITSIEDGKKVLAIIQSIPTTMEPIVE